MSDPWFKFFPTDWRSDPALRMCSLAARGLWVEMLGLMHEAVPYGHLLVSGRSVTDAQLAVLAGAPSEQIPDLIGELESAGVFSRTKEGVIFSRKMTRTAKKSAVARKNGKKGGNPSICKKRENSAWDNQGLKGEDITQKPEARSQKPDKTSSSSSAREAPDPNHGLVPRLTHALGFDHHGAIPKYWITPDAALIVGRWQSELRLTDDEIVSVAKGSAKAHGSPARGPTVLNEAMARYAAAKAAPLLTATIEDRANVQQPPRRQPTASAADDAFARRIHAAARSRSPSDGNFGFG